MTRHISARTVASMLGIKTATLAKWRRQGRGPRKFVKLSATFVVYELAEVERYLEKKSLVSSND